MRLFVGLDLPSSVNDHLSLVSGGIPRARWQTAEQRHLTLRFIGEVDGGTQRAIVEALQTVRQPRFTMNLAGIGHFPPRGEPRSVWAGVEPPEPLHELAGKIEQTLRTIGLEPDSRNFAPHVTLARLRGAPKTKVIEFLQNQALLRTQSFEVDAFLLYSSILSPRGSKYTVEETFALDD
ncbi:MAG: RNA 2',3'-cyclic phosphodiesterase [Myxococcota bacterium]